MTRVSPPEVACKLLAHAEHAERMQLLSAAVEGAKKASERRRGARPRRASGPATDFRPSDARPPPHLRISRSRVLREQFLENAQLRRRHGDRIPGWAFQLRDRILADGGVVSELSRVPRHAARVLLRCADHYACPDAQRNVIMLGLVLGWLSSRHPGRCGRASIIAGIPLSAWAALTQKADGSRYSDSYVAHGWHGRGDTFTYAGRLVGAEGAQRGFLATLIAEGFLQCWTPPAQAVPQWMVGDSGHPFDCWRLVPDYAFGRGPPPS